jgi:hypothetical protein
MRIAFILRAAFWGFLAVSAVLARQQSAAQAPTDPAVILKAQREQTGQLAAAWLHSGDPRLQAWGAYVVLRDKHKEFIPDLVAMVHDYNVAGWQFPPAEEDRHDAMLAVLDDLIQFYVVIPAPDAAKLYPEFPAQSILLLSRGNKDATNFFMEVFRDEKLHPWEWQAAGNFLTQIKAPGFAADVLSKMTVHATIKVTTTGEIRFYGGVASGCSFAIPKAKPDWPEVGNYLLTGSVAPESDWPRVGAEKYFEQHSAAALFLLDGPIPVYSQRTIDALYDQIRHARVDGNGCGANYVDWDSLLERYVTRMVSAKQDNPPLKSHFDEMITWKDQNEYLQYLGNLVRQQRDAFAEVARKLKEGGWITAEESADVKLKFEITIVDDRNDRTAPLPHVENLGENVTVKMCAADSLRHSCSAP